MSISESERYLATQELYLKICTCYFAEEELRRDHFASTSSVDWEALCWFAQGHKIVSDLHHKLTKLNVLESLPDAEREYLEGAAFLEVDDARTALIEIHSIQELLNQSGLDVVWLKGAAMLLGGYFDLLGTRRMADIDLLIPHEQLDIAVEILENEGYALEILMPRPITSYFRSKHIPQLINSRCVFAIEMHHRLFSPGTANIDQLEPPNLLQGATFLSNHNDTVYRIPAVESMFLHVFIESQVVDDHEMSGVDCYKAMLDAVSLVRHAKMFSWSCIRECIQQAGMEANLALFVKRIEQCVYPPAVDWEIARVPIKVRLSFNRYAKIHPGLTSAFGTTLLHFRSINRIFDSRNEHRILNNANRHNPKYAPKGIALFNKTWWAKRKYFWNKVVTGKNSDQ